MVASDRARALLRAGEPSLFLTCSFLLTVVLARSFLIQSDEGYTLNAAWQVWTGLKMYDDFRVFVGPGSGYAIYWVWRLVGSPSFLAARLVSLALSFWATTGLYLLLRRLGVRGVSLATAVIAWLSVSALYVLLNHNSFSAFAAIWFLLALVRIVQARSAGAAVGDRLRDHALLGAAAGVVFLFLPMKALLLASTAALFLFATGRSSRLRPLLALCAGFALVVAPLFLVWSPVTLVRQWLIIPLTGNYLGHTSASGRFVVAAIAVVAAMGWMSLRLRDRVLQALTVVQAALFLGMSHNMEGSHFAINGFPAIVFAFHVAHDRLVRPREGREMFTPTLVAIFVGALLLWRAITPAGAGFGQVSVLEADLLGRRPKLVLKPRILQAHAIYAGPFLPGLYYLLGKKNPFFVSETVVCDDACQRQLVTQLEAVKPELAFLDYDMIDHLHYPLTGPVDVYLRDHYTPCPTHGIPVSAIDPSWCP